ncbi:MAG TPA: cytochrome b N-terminal domain-containing protein [Galbitalea sp.]|jgi:ubiquinol-cytochrome c reductase cytochrome b subunit|nr:cytochrome b N-terminal domain-containing protein [Galbitalea sp.]
MPVDRRRRGGSLTDRISDYFVNRSSLGRRIAALAGELRQRRVPLHWTTMFGVVSMACVVVLFATGVFLMFLYTPSGTPVVYRGGYLPLHGTTMSKALSSTLAISFAVQGGLVIRQAHHWAALLLPVSLILQLLVSFFTGAFRTPRKTGWVLLFFILIVALVGGWSGYALPDDMLSGTGLRIVQGIVVGIPVVGAWASALLFGGGFPGQIIEHLYPIHIVIVPVLLVLFLAARIRSGYLKRPAQLPGPGRTEDNVVGVAILPTAATRAGGLLLVVMGLLFFVSATFTVSPIWLYGPSSPADASADSQPDWYTGFLDGALRLIPSGWGFVWLGHTWALAILIPLAVVGAFLLVVLAYPFIEQWISGDHRDHNLLDRPRNTPTRTAIGVAGMTFYGALWGAGSADLIATHFQVTLESVLAFYQVLALAGPIAGFVVTRRICFALQRRDREMLLHGYETGRVVRMPGGEYVEVHRQLDAFERWRLVNASDYAPIRVTPDARGHIGAGMRIRARLSDFFFEERIAPVSRSDAAISDRTP